ncbi:MAG: hypothetical protein ABIQ47_02475 [Tepidiformaceae bacterium]
MSIPEHANRHPLAIAWIGPSGPKGGWPERPATKGPVALLPDLGLEFTSGRAQEIVIAEGVTGDVQDHSRSIAGSD